MSYETTAADGTPATLTAPPSDESKRRVLAQSRAYTGILAQTSELLDILAADAELAALMNSTGYTSPQIAGAQALRDTAHARFLARQQAMARHRAAAAALQKTFGDALITYRELRGIARNALDGNERIALAVAERFPQDRTGFAQMARAFYESALAEPAHLETLAAHGVPETRIQNALTELDTFNTALIEYEIARADALRATSERDAAVLALRDWRTRFRRRARIATRGRRDLQAKLDL